MQTNAWRFHLVIGQWLVGWAHVRSQCVHASSERQQSLLGPSSWASLKLLTSPSLWGAHFLSSFAFTVFSVSSFSLCVTFKLSPIPIPVCLVSLSALKDRHAVNREPLLADRSHVCSLYPSQASCKLLTWGLHSPTLSWDCQNPFICWFLTKSFFL